MNGMWERKKEPGRYVVNGMSKIIRKTEEKQSVRELVREKHCLQILKKLLPCRHIIGPKRIAFTFSGLSNITVFKCPC